MFLLCYTTYWSRNSQRRNTMLSTWELALLIWLPTSHLSGNDCYRVQICPEEGDRNFTPEGILTIHRNLCTLSAEKNNLVISLIAKDIYMHCILMFYMKTIITLKTFHASQLSQIPKLIRFFHYTVFHKSAV